MLAMDEAVENYKKGKVSDPIDTSDIDEVTATLRLDGFEITPEDIELLKLIKSGETTSEDARLEILKKLES